MDSPGGSPKLDSPSGRMSTIDCPNLSPVPDSPNDPMEQKNDHPQIEKYEEDADLDSPNDTMAQDSHDPKSKDADENVDLASPNDIREQDSDQPESEEDPDDDVDLDSQINTQEEDRDNATRDDPDADVVAHNVLLHADLLQIDTQRSVRSHGATLDEILGREEIDDEIRASFEVRDTARTPAPVWEQAGEEEEHAGAGDPAPTEFKLTYAKKYEAKLAPRQRQAAEPVSMVALLSDDEDGDYEEEEREIPVTSGRSSGLTTLPSQRSLGESDGSRDELKNSPLSDDSRNISLENPEPSQNARRSKDETNERPRTHPLTSQDMRLARPIDIDARSKHDSDPSLDWTVSRAHTYGGFRGGLTPPLSFRAKELLSKKPLPPLPVQAPKSSSSAEPAEPQKNPLTEPVMSLTRRRLGHKVYIERSPRGKDARRKDRGVQFMLAEDEGIGPSRSPSPTPGDEPPAQDASPRSTTSSKSDDVFSRQVSAEPPAPRGVNFLAPPPEIRVQKSSTIASSTAARDASFVESEAGSSSPSTSDYGVSISDSDEFDTDLEDAPGPPAVRDVYVGTAAYSAACQRLGCPPQRAVVRALSEEVRVRQRAVHRALGDQVMSLKYRNLSAVDIQAITTALVKNVRVSSLVLEDIGLDHTGTFHVAQLLQENENFTEVNLAHNPAMGAGGALSLSEMLCFNKTLKVLDLSGAMMGEAGAESLAVALANNVTLTTLNISRNALGERGGVLLGTALGSNERLETLDISWNSIRAKGAVAFCKGLQFNQHLREVNLSWNGLGYEGSLALNTLLRKNVTIETLDVSHNHITWQGALLLTPGLKANTSLRELVIGGNPITTTGGMDLIQALSENAASGLRLLSMRRVPVVGEFEMIASMLADSRGLKYEHGGIVNSHDVVGMRNDKRIDPMQRVINYMKEKELRVTEMFRGMDKSAGNRLDPEEFKTRLRKAGLNLSRYEVDELIEYLQKKAKAQSGDLNVANMMKGVSHHMRKERLEKVKEKERALKLKDYHKKILTEPQALPPLVDDTLTSRSDANSMAGVVSVGQRSLVSPLSNTTPASFGGFSVGGMKMGLLRPPSLPVGAPAGMMSMAGGLGSKPKEFGKTEVKKPKRKKKRKH